jgi:L-alanine-DL-glutamate epimerase-like enolase superfamily enzyme
MKNLESYESALNCVNTCSRPSELRITDMKVCDLEYPLYTTIIKITTNQGIEGYGQVRESGSRLYATMLKRLIIGENPCDVDRLFRRIKQFGYHGHQAGGVSGIEIALWDLAGKAYGVPVWQMLGGKYRDKIRIYCDTDVDGKPEGKKMGAVLKERIEKNKYTFMKMDLSVEEILFGIPGTLTSPSGFIEDYINAMKDWGDRSPFHNRTMRKEKLSRDEQLEFYRKRNRGLEITNLGGPLTSMHITEKGLDLMEQYVADVRSVVGYEIPIATDHFGHIGVDDIIRLSQRLEKYNIAWMEDVIPWMMTEHLAKINHFSRIPICTGEDIFLKEGFKKLLENKAVSLVHPDIISSGGIMEMKKISDLALDYGVPMAIHMNESPIGAMAAVNAAASCENFLALEFHHHDLPWWSDLVNAHANPIVQNGYIEVPRGPGLGISSLNDEVLAEHLHPDSKAVWEDTDEWDDWAAWDRIWL